MVAESSRSSEKSRRSADFPSAASLGAAIEDYLKAIYQLSLASERVAPSNVATKLGISQAAVTKMIKRLRTRRLVRYGRPQGVVLTDSGRRVALEMIRHHRLLEAYLHKALGYSWDEVDREAEILEHAISEEFEDRIDQLLGHPTHDPHGSPIPTKDGRVEDVDFPSLSDLAVGQRAMIRRVDGRNPDKLRYLGELGLYPDTPVQLLEREPFGGPLRLLVKGKKRAIGPELARHVFVAVQEGSAKESSSS